MMDGPQEFKIIATLTNGEEIVLETKKDYLFANAPNNFENCLRVELDNILGKMRNTGWVVNEADTVMVRAEHIMTLRMEYRPYPKETGTMTPTFHYRLVGILPDESEITLHVKTTSIDTHRIDKIFDMDEVMEGISRTNWTWDMEHKMVMRSSAIIGLRMDKTCMWGELE